MLNQTNLLTVALFILAGCISLLCWGYLDNRQATERLNTEMEDKIYTIIRANENSVSVNTNNITLNSRAIIATSDKVSSLSSKITIAETKLIAGKDDRKDINLLIKETSILEERVRVLREDVEELERTVYYE